MKATSNLRPQTSNPSLRQDLTWLKRTRTVNLRYDLLFAVCMASSFTGLLFLIVK
jgi:hypothetical protein